MKRLSAALLFAAMLLPGSGCCSVCPGRDVPVSLEGLYNFVNYFDKGYVYFPHSCPPCPYYGGGYHGGYHAPVTVYESPAAMDEPAPIPAPQPDPASYDYE